MVRKVKANEVKKTTKRQKKEADLVEKVKTSVEDGVKTVKGKIEEGVNMFSDEIDTVKETSFDILKWIKNNWNILVGIPFLAIGLRKLGDLIVGGLLIVVGVLFLTGYIGNGKKQ